MSGLETLAAIGTVASIGSTVMGGIQAKQAGKAQKDAAKDKAMQERAAAAREAQEKGRQIEDVMGRQSALAASSGGGVNDPTILDLSIDTEARGRRQQEDILAAGEQRATSLENAGDAAKYAGKQAFTGSLIKAGATAATAATRMSEKFGWGSTNEGTDPATGTPLAKGRKRPFEYGYF